MSAEACQRLLYVSYAASAGSVAATIGLALLFRWHSRQQATLLRVLQLYHEQEVRVLVEAVELAREERDRLQREDTEKQAKIDWLLGALELPKADKEDGA